VAAHPITQVETAVEKRTVEKAFLIRIAVGRCITIFAIRLFTYVQDRVQSPLNLRIKRYYALRTFWAMARLDVPTFEDDVVQQQLQQSVSHSSRTSIAWDVVSTFLKIGSSAMRLFAQIAVLASVLSEQRDGHLLLMLTFAHLFMEWLSNYHGMLQRSGGESTSFFCVTQNSTRL
jgi:hypothetical protein